jgi:two-component system sensor histidine kinase KdpD
MEEFKRPDPDKLLAQIKKADSQKGRLKIFFGMSAGVGKTYAMLKEAHLLLERGEDIVIGWLESHGRIETDLLVDGIIILPHKKVEYRGIKLEEFDLEALLVRKPAFALIDELAHSNVPGLKHPKRYQDIIELLDAGINVYTTVNIQHLESIADVVEEMTNVRIYERIPDSVFDMADEVQFVDLPPEELRQRLEEGKVYTGDKTREAIENFFKKENLAMLRELALRHATHLASHQLTNILRGETQSISASDSQKIVVAISASPNSEYLIRWTRRFAYNLKASWTCIYIETGVKLTENDKNLLTRHITLARNLGANVVTFPSDDVVSGLLAYAQKNQIPTLVIGKSGITKPSVLFKRTNISTRLIQESGQMVVVAVQENVSAPGFRQQFKKRVEQLPFWQFVVSLSIITLVTVFNLLLSPYTGYWSAAVFYLATISFLALVIERLPLLIAATYSALLWNFVFIPPLYTFAIHKLEDILMFIFYFILALTSSWMTNKVKRNERMLKMREQRMTLLNELSEALEESNGVSKAIEVGSKYLSSAFNVDVILYLKREEDDTLSDIPVNNSLRTDEKEFAAARYCFIQGIATGRFTSTLPSAVYHYVPMAAPGGTIGVIGIKLGQDRAWTDDQESFLFTLTSTLSLATQREILYERNRKNMLVQESERLSRILLNSVSHELRTPLTVIQGSASALLDRETAIDESVRNQLVKEILTGTERLNNIVENLLSMSRLEAGQLKLKIALNDPEELIILSLRSIANELSHRTVNLNLPGSLPAVPCDNLLIMQVIANLLQNANRYSPPGTSLEIFLEVREQKLFFIIRDHGPGVKEEDLPHLFDKFYRGQTVKTEGVGLGLSICKAIVEAHHGRIITYNHPAGGLLVEFSLPLDTNYFKESKK